MYTIRKQCECGSSTYKKDFDVLGSDTYVHFFSCSNCGHRDYYTPKKKPSIRYYAYESSYGYDRYFNGNTFSVTNEMKCYVKKGALMRALSCYPSEMSIKIESFNLEDL